MMFLINHTVGSLNRSLNSGLLFYQINSRNQIDYDIVMVWRLLFNPKAI